MTVRTILEAKGSNEVHTIAPGRTVEEAIRRLVDHNVGSLVVVEAEGAPVGIVTERDILRLASRGADRLAVTRVEEIMTSDLIVGQPDDTIDYCMGIMTQNRIRHLPIVGATGLAGMVSIGDVVKVQLDETVYENRHLKRYIEGTY